MGHVLDADTHIAEPPEMWDFLDPDWHKRRPVVVQVPEDTLYGGVDHIVAHRRPDLPASCRTGRQLPRYTHGAEERA